VVLRRGLLEELLDEALHVAGGGDATVEELSVELAELFDGEFVQDRLNRPQHLDVIVNAACALLRPGVRRWAQRLPLS